jgi:MFS transporter, PAT family, beta-lactamase induction signal transducer AmpG
MTAESEPRYTPPWIFGITNIPFGVAGNFTGIAVPFILRQAGLPLEKIAFVAALALVPSSCQWFTAPILDLGMRRRSWLILLATLGSFFLAGSLFVDVHKDLVLYEMMLMAGMGLVGLVASCNGALVSTTVDPTKRGKAAGFVTAGNLGSAVLGGGMVLTLTNCCSVQAAAIGLFLALTLPSLAALAINEPPLKKESVVEHVRVMVKDVWRAIRARWGWTGLLFCCSPVSTVALLQLFSAMGKNYHVSDNVVTIVNGYVGGFITAGGALVAGWALDRANRRQLFLLGGILTAICSIAMTLFPATQETYIVFVCIYLLIAGLAYSSFSAVVYEIVGCAGSSASTLYSIFPAVGNMAIAYTVFVDGKASHWFAGMAPNPALTGRYELNGLCYADAAMNIAGVVFLVLLTYLVIKKNKGAEGEPAAVAVSDKEAVDPN